MIHSTESVCSDYVKIFKSYTCVEDLPIGVGAQGKTFLVQKDSTKYILKIQNQSSLSANELRILRLVQSKKYLVQLVEFKKRNSKLYTIISYGAKGTLDSFLNKSKHLLEYPNAVAFIKKLMLGLKNLHKSGFVHADLKPENIVVDENNDPLIIDFDMSVPMRRKAMPRGTLSFMSPEVLQAFSYQTEVVFTPEVDLYALGLIFYLIVKRKPAIVLPSLNYLLLLSSPVEFDKGDKQQFYDFVSEIVKPLSSRKEFLNSLYQLNSMCTYPTEEVLGKRVVYKMKKFATDEELKNLEGFKYTTLFVGALFFLGVLFILGLLIKIVKKRLKYSYEKSLAKKLVEEKKQEDTEHTSDK